MEQLESPQIDIRADFDALISVVRHVGEWMRDTGKPNYSDWWDPSKVSKELIAKYAKPDECFVAFVDGRPAATAIVQTEENQTFQDWAPIDKGKKPTPAVYIAYVAVERDFAGHDLVAVLMDKAEAIALEHGASAVRLDALATEPKLRELYEGLGFKQVGTAQEGDRLTAFYEKPVTLHS